MVCAPVRSIIPSLKLRNYFSVQAHKPCSISHIVYDTITNSNDMKQRIFHEFRAVLNIRNDLGKMSGCN